MVKQKHKLLCPKCKKMDNQHPSSEKEMVQRLGTPYPYRIKV